MSPSFDTLGFGFLNHYVQDETARIPIRWYVLNIGRRIRSSDALMKKLRILVADDHALMRRGIKTLLKSHAGWEVCGEARTGRDAVAMAETLKPDIVILDISMPDLNGVDAAKRIRKISSNSEVLILSMHYSEQLIREILEGGCSRIYRKVGF